MPKTRSNKSRSAKSRSAKSRSVNSRSAKSSRNGVRSRSSRSKSSSRAVRKMRKSQSKFRKVGGGIKEIIRRAFKIKQRGKSVPTTTPATKSKQANGVASQKTLSTMEIEKLRSNALDARKLSTNFHTGSSSDTPVYLRRNNMARGKGDTSEETKKKASANFKPVPSILQTQIGDIIAKAIKSSPDFAFNSIKTNSTIFNDIMKIAKPNIDLRKKQKDYKTVYLRNFSPIDYFDQNYSNIFAIKPNEPRTYKALNEDGREQIRLSVLVNQINEKFNKYLHDPYRNNEFKNGLIDDTFDVTDMNALNKLARTWSYYVVNKSNEDQFKIEISEYFRERTAPGQAIDANDFIYKLNDNLAQFKTKNLYKSDFFEKEALLSDPLIKKISNAEDTLAVYNKYRLLNDSKYKIILQVIKNEIKSKYPEYVSRL